MHCVLTADLASLLSAQGTAIIQGRSAFAAPAVAQYWASSKHRFERWHQSLSQYRRAEQSGDYDVMRHWWRDHVVVMEEVLVTEILTRVVAALATALDARLGSDEISPVTHSVWLAHVDARNRVQKIMLFGRGNSIEDAVRLNRLRQAVESWTDAMIGRLDFQTSRHLQYAFDSARAAQYAEDMRPLRREACGTTAVWLMNASMHESLSRRANQQAALPEANRQVCEAVLWMLRPNLFDGLGTLKSIWLHQLESSDLRSDQACCPDWAAASLAEKAAGKSPMNQPHFERWYQ